MPKKRKSSVSGASPEIIVAGHICLDLTPSFASEGKRDYKDLIAPGKLVNVGPCIISTGGPVSNTGLALAILGQSVGLMGKTGNDTFGTILRNKMSEWGLDGSILKIDGEQTSYTIVVVPPGIDRTFLHNPGANNSYSSNDVAFKSLEKVKLFHFGYPPLMKTMFKDGGKELIDLFKKAKKAGATTSLDMSLPDPDSESGQVDWKSVLKKLLPYVDLFLPSGEEVMFFLDKGRFFEKRKLAKEKGRDVLDFYTGEDLSFLSGKLIEMGAGLTTLKIGHRGMYLRTSGMERLNQFGRAKTGCGSNKARTSDAATSSWVNRELWEPAFKVEKLVSATGSGDSSIAGLLSSFMRGESVEQALKFATAAGAQNVQVADAVSGIKDFAETRRMIPKWKKDETTAAQQTDIGWNWHSQGRIWTGPNDRKN